MPTIKVSPPSASLARSMDRSSKKDVNNEKLMVALRIRPLRQEEIAKGFQSVADAVDQQMVILSDASPDSRRGHLRKTRANDRQYLFDVALGADISQQEVYAKTTKHLVQSVLDGYNATVFAYGATGAGKTYTMVGTQQHPGCMVRALNDLFNAMENNDEMVFKVTMSYLEIYNENIRDLLNPTSGHLDLRDDSKGKNIQVAGLTEINTKSTEEVMRLLQRGNRERTTEPTAANKTSSRSHALLIVNVRQTAKSKSQIKAAVKVARLYMIDLAGSERATNTQNRGLRLKEGAHINRSLLALGNVINALAEQKTGHVNYRDSKLTRLLKDALSGNCHTVMIAHISPANKHREESRNTLVYADRAKNISNKVRKNVLDVQYHVSQYQTIISELKGEIARLKEKMQFDPSQNYAQQASGGGHKKIQEEFRELREAVVLNFSEQMKLRHRLMEIDNHILSLHMEFEKQNIIITEWEKQRKTSRRLSYPVPNPNEEPQAEEMRGFDRAEPEEDDGDDDEEEDAYKADNEESGFEDNASEHDARYDEAEARVEDDQEAEEAAAPAAHGHRRRTVSTSFLPDQNEDIEDPEDPDEIKEAWEEILLIQREQERYSFIRMDLQHDLEQLKKEQSKLEDELPKRISTLDEAEILGLLCKVHELEIAKVEMQTEALLQQHEVRRRDLLLLKYDRQRSLMDEIIQKQRSLIEGHSMVMPPELMDLYTLYHQELGARSENENRILSDINVMMRAPSVLSLRGPELDEKTDRLPPIVQESPRGRLVQSAHSSSNEDVTERPTSFLASALLELPPIAGKARLTRSHSLMHAKAKNDTAKPKNREVEAAHHHHHSRAGKPSWRQSIFSSTNWSRPVRSNLWDAQNEERKILERSWKSRKHTDPFQNIGYPLHRQ